MKKKLLTLFGLASLSYSYGQLVNQGGTIVIEAGATLVVEGSVQNSLSGVGATIINNGTLEVQGNMTSDASSNVRGTGTYKFTGTANANLSILNDTLQNVNIDKNGGDVILLNPVHISGTLSFGAAGNSNIQLNGQTMTFLSLAPSPSTNGDGGYIEADGTGTITKIFGSAGTFVFPVGDVDEHSPISFTASAAGNASVTKVVDAVHPNKQHAISNFITRYWQVSNTILGTYAGTYKPVDVNGSPLTAYRRTGSNWTDSNTAVASNTATIASVPAGSHDITALAQGLREFSLTALLQGPVDTTTYLMSTSLPALVGPASPLFPTTSPYGTGESVASIPMNVTDWINVQVVDPSNAATIYGQASGFIRNNGSIVGTDGTSPLQIAIGNNATGSVKLKHRNHLSTRTIGQSLPSGSTFTFDFSSAANNTGVPATSNVYNFVAADSSAVHVSVSTTPLNLTNPQKQLKLTGTIRFGMWLGDINQDNFIKYNLSNNDRALIYLAIGSGNANITINGYRVEDCNMDGLVKYNLSSNDRALIYGNIGFGNANVILKSHN
jgi:hypothetical protein